MTTGHDQGPHAPGRAAGILFQLRILVLAAFVLATLGAGWLLFAHPVAVPVSLMAMVAGGGVIAAAGAYLCLRHAGLALIVTFVPAAGMVCAAALSTYLQFPMLDVAQLLTAYVCGFAVALLIGDEIALRLTQADPAQACERAFAATTRAALLMCAAAALLPLSLASISQNWLMIVPVAIAGGFAVFFAWLITPLVARLLSYSENFVTRSNRAHEARERILERTSAVVRPRYGTSVAGIALVFSVLGFFGADVNVDAMSSRDFLFAGAIAFGVLVLGFAAAWDWRAALAASLCMVPVSLCGLWAMAKLQLSFDDTLWLVFVQALVAALVPLGFAAMHIGHYLRGDDDATIAAARMLNRNGGALVLVALIACAALLGFVLADKAIIVVCIMLLGGGIAAVLFFPAVMVSLEALMPRQKSVEARYRVG
ncbi:MAG TPA: hypothetical protein VFI93_05445 [Rhizomicrobium sp.]|nr:hypothetical protein [Rhizomicrobium sp.]